jgi:tyrosine decarboxylase/aspartate 1-decarboxylase
VAGDSVETRSARARHIFDNCAKFNLHLALVQLPEAIFTAKSAVQAASVTCLRSVLMKPEHAEWLGAIWERLSQATDRALEE